MNASSHTNRVPAYLRNAAVVTAVVLGVAFFGADQLNGHFAAKQAAKDAATLAPWAFASNTCRMPDGTKVELVAPTMKEELDGLYWAKETADGRKLHTYTTANTSQGAWYCVMAWRKR